MTGTRRTLLAGLVAAPAIDGIPIAVPAAVASSAFVLAWAAYEPYRDTAGCRGLDDATTDAWCGQQLQATADLAEAPAGNLVELEVKLSAGIYWFDQSGTASCMAGEEADLLRACLTDLRAIIAGGPA